MNYKIGIAILHVSDIKRAKAFYAGTLGLSVLDDHEPHFVMLGTAGDAMLGLEDVARTKNKSVHPGSVELGLDVADADATWREWKSKGVNLLTEPKDLEFGRAFDALDPDGHPLTVYQPPAR